MKKGKYEGAYNAKRMNVRILFLVMALAVVVSCFVGSTVAWLLTSETVTNTFTYGDINIALKETDTGLDDDGDSDTNDYVMIPGETIAKDPQVTVIKGSEDCWLFVKLTESENLDAFIKYEVNSQVWTQLYDETGAAVEGVYYCLVTDLTEDYTTDIIGYTDADGVYHANEVQVLETVTKAMLNELDDGDEDDGYPTLTVSAYAVQYSGFEVGADGENAAAYLAWDTAVVGSDTTGTNP